MLNLDFGSERNGEYPVTIKAVQTATDEEVVTWLNELPVPTTDEEVELFNEVFNQFHLRGGRA